MDKPDPASPGNTDSASADQSKHEKLPRTVIVLGLVSFFNDFASDIVIPLIPILLATVLRPGRWRWV
jgi:hypothetical protein